jgi:hypothetical protein
MKALAYAALLWFGGLVAYAHGQALPFPGPGGNAGGAAPTCTTGVAASSLLLHMDSNTFPDSSANAFATAQINSPVTADTTNKQFGAASMLGNFNGNAIANGKGVQLSANQSALNPGTGDFTIDFWWRPTANSNFQVPLDYGFTGGASILLETPSSSSAAVGVYMPSLVITASVAPTLNTWNYIKLYRQGTSLNLLQNGTNVGSATNSENVNAATNKYTFGTQGGLGGGTQGYFSISGNMDEVRILIGTADTSTSVPTLPWCN